MDDCSGSSIKQAAPNARLSVGVYRTRARCRRLGPRRVLSNDTAVNIRLARAGLGPAIVYQDQVRDEIARGELVPVLEKILRAIPGYYLFYPHRGHASPALRALIDHLRESRQSRRTQKPRSRRHPQAGQ